MTPLILILGGGIGAGLYLLVRALIAPQPALPAALERLSASTPGDNTLAVKPRGLEERLGAWTERAIAHVPMIITPEHDLALIDWSARKFYGQKAMAALAGLLFPVIMSMLAYLGNIALPIPITVGTMAVLAGVFFFLPDIEVRQRAARRRIHYRKVIAAYVDFVALARIGGASASQSLRDAAMVGDNELFVRIQQLIERSRLRGTSAWGDLRELGDELGISELHEIADIVRLSGEEGASIWENLRSHASSMRNAQLRTEQGSANAKSESMSMPLAVLAGAFVSLLIAPALLTLASS
ncbi:hypothetical protein [Brachybacterium kimchii]|uniref:Type II secretion system protein GspF domain-containing protein n=1 Tax=Brachybacterium kimchii TaxID=2942909 RepID=A0ABY4ND37_9MICO|nr:hypothetical protein [Brachybacterium kimchii]UQN31826.1 hypothetical protein M4486_19745 [Brachybacterium kimchii]